MMINFQEPTTAVTTSAIRSPRVDGRKHTDLAGLSDRKYDNRSRSIVLSCGALMIGGESIDISSKNRSHYYRLKAIDV